MSDSDVDTSRTVVRTYVPAYQREEWDDHAEELGMSRSEFVRTMVQAGRRTFDQGRETTDTPPDSAQSTGETPSDAGSQSEDIQERVLTVLSDGEYYSWDELVDAVVDDIEAELDAALDDLQTSNRVRYSGRNGGYTLQE